MDKEQINQFIATNGQLFKVTNTEECHKGYQYIDGMNVLPHNEMFCDDDTQSCVSGRLYFTNREFLHKFYQYGVWLREITLPVNEEDFQLVSDPSGDKWGANMLYLGQKYPLYSLDTFKKFNLQVNNKYVQNACLGQDIDLVTYLSQHYKNTFDSNTKYECLKFLLANHKYEEFKSLHAKKKDLFCDNSLNNKILSTNNTNLIIWAINEARLRFDTYTILQICNIDVLDRIYDDIFTDYDFYHENYLYHNDRPEILEWLCAKGCPLTSDIMQDAIKNHYAYKNSNKLNKVKWLAEHNCPYNGHFITTHYDAETLAVLKNVYPSAKFYETKEEYERAIENRSYIFFGLFTAITMAIPFISSFLKKRKN